MLHFKEDLISITEMGNGVSGIHFNLGSRKNRQPQHLNEYCFIFFAKHCQRMDHWKLKDNVYSKSSGCCFFTGKFLWAFKWVTGREDGLCFAWQRSTLNETFLYFYVSFGENQPLFSANRVSYSVFSKERVFLTRDEILSDSTKSWQSVRSVISFLNYCLIRHLLCFRAHN